VIHPDGKEELQITGLESVRSDWTPLARRAQQELLWRVFHNEASEGWIRSLVNDLYGGRCDDELIYSRRLRKAPEAYIKQIPPHVKAALLLSYEQRREGGNVINYVMTRRGPMPVQLPHDDLDYEHYAVKQLKPVVEELLSLTGIRVDAILKGEEQLELFD
jgi:DNA polymerase-2